MSYRVKTRKGYWEERESYRDPVTGKPRSRFLRYLGKLGQVDWSATLYGLPEDRAMRAAERAAEKAEMHKGPAAEEVSRLPQGLHLGPSEPVPLDKEVVNAGGAVSDELAHGQPDNHAQGECGEADSGGDGDVAIGH